MAQVNQQNMNSKSSHSWSFKPVAKKDLDNRQWPFRVIRDEGKPTKFEARSITDLNRSFEGTPYNLNDCPVVKGRYTLLFECFKDRYGAVTDKITHLLLTYDSVYFLLKDETDVKYFTFGNNVLQMEDLNGILSNILYKCKYLDNNIRQSFQMYKDSKDIMYENQLKKDIQFYISTRRKMKILDNSKPMIDVLKSELNFTSLQYLIFMPYPEMAKDYQRYVIEGFRRNNIEVTAIPEMTEEIKKLPNLNMEVEAIEDFVKGLERKEFYRSIRKVYLLGNKNQLSSSVVKDLFLKVNKSDFSVGRIYMSDAEIKAVEQNRINAQKDLEKAQKEEVLAKAKEIEEREKVEKALEKSVPIIKEISSMTKLMITTMKECENIYNAGVMANTVEFGIWIKEYKKSLIQNKIDAAYTYRHKNTDKTIPVCSVLTEVIGDDSINSKVGILSINDLDYFKNNIVPTYFKDDRHTFKSIGCGFNRLDEVEILHKTLLEIRDNMTELFEIFIGTQYALFGTFMKRYGLGGINIVKNLLTYLKGIYVDGRPLYLTENVKERANEVFYMIYQNRNNLDNYTSEVAHNEIGVFADFVMTYLKLISNNNIVVLTHSDAVKVKETQLINLYKTYQGVVLIISQCKKLCNLDHDNSEVLNMVDVAVNSILENN